MAEMSTAPADQDDHTQDDQTQDGQPQDVGVSRRWVVNRIAWTSAAATAGAVLPAAPALAGPAARPSSPLPEVKGKPKGDLTELTAAQIVGYIRKGRLTAADMVHAYVDRIEEHDDVYQAYVDRPSRKTLVTLAERRVSRVGPLAGIGLAPKDNFYTRDLLTEGGSLVYQGFRPTYNATAIKLLRRAGGLVLGKASMGPLAGGRATVYGTEIPTTRNAWTPDDVRYSPAGSSSGPGAAVAARIATAGIGTQTGGSIMGPAVAEGLTAVKPTFGRTSLHGVIPLTFTRDHVGPMCRDAMDAAMLLQVLAKPDPKDPRTQGLPAAPDYIRAATPVVRGKRTALRWRTRIGYWPGYLTTNDEATNQMRAATLRTLERMHNCSVIGEVTIPDDWDALTANPLGGSYAEPTPAFIDKLREDVRPFAQRLPRMLNGMLQSGDTYIRVQQARLLLAQRMMAQIFSSCDVLFTTSTGAFDSVGFPLLCMPTGFSPDPTTGYTVPRGVTIGAAPFGEQRLLSVAAAFQAETSFHLVRPPEPGTPPPLRAAPRRTAGRVATVPALDEPDDLE